MLCEFSAAGFSVSSRLIIQEGVVGFVMVIYLSVGFTLLIVGSRVKCHQRTIMEMYSCGVVVILSLHCDL